MRRRRRAGRLVRRGSSLYSQGKEELIIRECFRDMDGGVFLDVGAGHWRDDSTTYYLEQHRRWAGLAVDARPDLADGYRDHRPDTVFVNKVVTDHSDDECTVYLAGNLTSLSYEYHLAFEHLRQVEPAAVTVATTTLDDLLDRHGIDRIDLLSMDIEESEEAALAGFDIERFAPQLVGIEVGSHRAGAMTRRYFDAHGYRRLARYLPYDPVNWWFLSPRATHAG